MAPTNDDRRVKQFQAAHGRYWRLCGEQDDLDLMIAESEDRLAETTARLAALRARQAPIDAKVMAARAALDRIIASAEGAP